MCVFIHLHFTITFFVASAFSLVAAAIGHPKNIFFFISSSSISYTLWTFGWMAIEQLSDWATEQLSNEQEVHTHTYNEKTNNCINIAIQRVVLLSRTHNFHTYKAVIFRIVRSAFLWNNTITHNHLISSWKLYWNFSLVIHSFALSLSSLLRPPRQAFFFLNSFFELSKSMEYENVKKKYQIIWC